MGLPKEWKKQLDSKWPSGPDNSITDVAGVSVGQVTVKNPKEGKEGEGAAGINTGVTVVMPHQGNLFQEKVLAGAAVINGFGKSIGLVQVEELGTIETPIVLTNTLSVGTAATALVKYSLENNPDIGVETGTVNPLVTECNDGRLNDIRGLHVTEDHVLLAIENAKLAGAAEAECGTAARMVGVVVEEGAVGAGTGMVCFGLKGGIGTASRKVELKDGSGFTIGALVMSNFGKPGDLVIGGERVMKRVPAFWEKNKEQGSEALHKQGPAEPREQDGSVPLPEQGSIIMILATDAPLDERQLKRMARRSGAALGRVGSYLGNGSGDIAIAFSTANKIPHYSEKSVLDMQMLFDADIDPIFEGTVEVCEEAIISSLYHAKTTTGVRGNTYMSLLDYMKLAGSKK